MAIFLTTIAVVAGWLVVEVFVFSRLRIGAYDTEYVPPSDGGVRPVTHDHESTASVYHAMDGRG